MTDDEIRDNADELEDEGTIPAIFDEDDELELDLPVEDLGLEDDEDESDDDDEEDDEDDLFDDVEPEDGF
jgi:hypothetical protein